MQKFYFITKAFISLPKVLYAHDVTNI